MRECLILTLFLFGYTALAQPTAKWRSTQNTTNLGFRIFELNRGSTNSINQWVNQHLNQAPRSHSGSTHARPSPRATPGPTRSSATPAFTQPRIRVIPPTRNSSSFSNRGAKNRSSLK